MAGPALDEFNEWLRCTGHEDGFRIGVGLNSGVVMAGNVGSETRLECTAIGDITNTASRIESMTKGTPYMIMRTESTRMMMLRARPELERIDAVAVRGRREEVEIWAPADGDEAPRAASDLPPSRADGPGH